jgi:DivIVA domain-containing protein
MELTLKRLLEQAKFTTTRKGYDQDEVDDFLDRAVAMATKVEARLTQALADAEKAGSAPAAAAPGRSEEEIRAEIDAQVEKRVAARLAEIEASAPQAPAVDDSAAAEEAARTLLLAQRTADAAVAEAKQEAAQILAKAREDAEQDRRTAAAQLEQERAEARERLTREIQALESARDGLRADVSALENHAEEQRLQLQSAVGELQRLLEDPAAFRLAPAPEARAVEVPTADPAPLLPAPPADPAPAADTGPTGSAGPEPEADASDPEEPAPSEDPEASLDVGPPTAPVAVVDLAPTVDPIAVASGEPGDTGATGPSASAAPVDDDSFLEELRKAMADEEPLGPREIEPTDSQQSFLEDERRGWRFGKRR